MLEEYPATLAYLYEAANQANTTLVSSISDTDTTITVGSTTGFPTTGIISIDDEIILYSSKDATHFYVYGSGDGRGHDSTAQSSHSAGARVERRITAIDQNTTNNTLRNVQFVVGFYDPVELNVGQLSATNVGLPYAFNVNYHRSARITYMIERVSDYGGGDDRVFEFGSMWMVYAEGVTNSTVTIVPEVTNSVNTLGDATTAGVTFSAFKDGDIVRLRYVSTDEGGADPESIYFQGTIQLFGTDGANTVDGLPATT